MPATTASAADMAVPRTWSTVAPVADSAAPVPPLWRILARRLSPPPPRTWQNRSRFWVGSWRSVSARHPTAAPGSTGTVTERRSSPGSPDFAPARGHVHHQSPIHARRHGAGPCAVATRVHRSSGSLQGDPDAQRLRRPTCLCLATWMDKSTPRRLGMQKNGAKRPSSPTPPQCSMALLGDRDNSHPCPVFAN